MEYKTIKRYFQTSKLFLILGFILASAGFLMYYIIGSARIIYQLGGIFMIAGVVIIVFFFAQLVSSNLLDRCVTDKIKIFETELKADFKPISRITPPEAMIIGEYITDNEELPIKKGKDSKYRTNMYKMAWIVTENTKLTIATKTFSLFDDSFSDEYKKYDYTDIGEIEFCENIRTLSNGKSFKHYSYKIKNKDGNIILNTPVKNDITVDQIKSTIEHNRDIIIKRAANI